MTQSGRLAAIKRVFPARQWLRVAFFPVEKEPVKIRHLCQELGNPINETLPVQNRPV